MLLGRTLRPHMMRCVTVSDLQLDVQQFSLRLLLNLSGLKRLPAQPDGLVLRPQD